MAKGQKRSNREIRKPKQEKAPPKAEPAFGNQIKLAANANAARQGQGLTVGCCEEGKLTSMKIVIEFYRPETRTTRTRRRPRSGGSATLYSGALDAEAMNEGTLQS